MSRQGNSSFSIDSLISPSFQSRYGPMSYNSGFMFMPPSGAGLLRTLGRTEPDSVLSSAMMHYAHAPFARYPLLGTTSPLYAGHLPSAYGNSDFTHIARNEYPISSINDYVTKSRKFQSDGHIETLSDREEEDEPAPKDLRMSVSSHIDIDPDIQDEDGISDGSVAGINLTSFFA